MAFPKTHVFVVDKYSYPVHTGKGFCGVKNPKGGGRLGLISDIKTYRKGDLVIFYQRRIDEAPLERGFRDVFKVISEPFYDDTDVEYNRNKVLGKCPTCGYPYSEGLSENWKPPQNFKCSNPNNSHEIPCGQHILPYRILIEPVVRFDKPVDDNSAYVDAEDYGELPTLRWRKITGAGRARSAQRILPEEAEKLIRLMKKINNNLESKERTTNYITVEEAERKKISETLQIRRGTSGKLLFYVKDNGSFAGEYGLETWLVENIDKDISSLKDVVGDLSELEYFGNNVQYGVGGENADILLLHKKDGKRFKVTVIELKKDKINADTIDQVLNPKKQNYAKWIGQLVTANVNPSITTLAIQPVMIGFEIIGDAIKRVKEIERDFHTFSQTITLNYQYRNRPNVIIKVLKPIFLTYKVEERIVNFKFKEYEL